MKIKLILTAAVFVLCIAPLFSQDTEQNLLLSYMDFPEPALRIGSIINDPIFALKIHRKIIIISEVKKEISEREKDLNDQTNPVVYYELGNYYKDLTENYTALKYYKRFLSSHTQTSSKISDDKISLSRHGDTYYSLSEIGSESDRIDYLEKSIIYYRKSLELDPKDKSLWIKLGDCYLGLEKGAEALFCYKKNINTGKNDFLLEARLQAALFQIYFEKLSNIKSENKIENEPINEGFEFDHIQSAINNSPAEYNRSLKLQHYIYLLRLMLLKSESFGNNNYDKELNFNKIFTNDEKNILVEIEKLLKTINNNNIYFIDAKYISGIVSYLKSDYIEADSTFKELLNEDEYKRSISDDLLYTRLYFLKKKDTAELFIDDIVKINPNPKYYLILAGIEFRNKNLVKSEMLCNRALKINRNYAEAYYALAVVYSAEGNYAAADEMIKTGNSLAYKIKFNKNILSNKMKLNEAIIALLKKEKERAYILLRSIISVDNDKKASELYNRYFNKK